MSKITGEIYSYTRVDREHALPDYVNIAPYYQVWVKIDGGPLVTSRLTDVGDEAIQIGSKVEMVTKLLGKDDDGRELLVYGMAFRAPITAMSEEEKKAARAEIWEYWDPKIIKARQEE